MGFWRDIGYSLGTCQELSRSDRDSVAAKRSGHPVGCTCSTCGLAREIATETDLYDDLGRRRR